MSLPKDKKYIPGTLLAMYKRQQDYREAIESLTRIRNDHKDTLSDYEYGTIHTLIRIFEHKVRENKFDPFK